MTKTAGKKKRKSLVGWTYSHWADWFNEDVCPFIEHRLPAVYKERELKQGTAVKVRITIEEIY